VFVAVVVFFSLFVTFFFQGFNRYYAPDFDPEKHKTLNGYAGKDVRIKTVRIELPWAIFCGHCKAHVAKGVRYNAKKAQRGNYLSTKIFEFSMTCHLCSGPIVIKTDPEHRDYAVVSGAIRKTEDYSARDARVIELPDDKQKKKLESDPLYKLEHVSADKKVAVDKSDTLGELIGMRSEQFEDDYAASRLMRSVFRKRKAEEIAVEKSNKEKVNCLFGSGSSWLICFFS
jgi:coiled-coil domain-containing protein 130